SYNVTKGTVFNVVTFVTVLSSLLVCAMLDIRLIREKPDFVRERLAARGGGDQRKSPEVLAVGGDGRKIETPLHRLQADRNRLSKEIGVERSHNEPSEELEAQVRKIGDEIGDLT